MTILITGSTGLIGRHLLSELAKQSLPVISLVRNMDKFNSLKLYGEAFKFDLARPDFERVEQLPPISTVVHLAGLVHSHDKNEFYFHNTEGTKNLVKLLQKSQVDHPVHFIYISSLTALGPLTARPDKRTDSPVGHYGQSKLSAEIFLKENLPSNFSLSIIRLPIVMGPYDDSYLDIFKTLSKGVSFTIGKRKVDKPLSFICVFDAVSKILQEIITPVPAPTPKYFAYPEDTSLKEILDVMVKVLGKKGPYINVAIPGKVMKLLIKTTKGLRILPKRLTEEKLKELMADGWVVPSSAEDHSLEEDEYKWDLFKTVKVTYDDYRKRKLL